MLEWYTRHTHVFLIGMLLSLTVVCFSREDPTEQDLVNTVLKQGNISDPHNIEYVRTLVEANPMHPRILELRLYYLSQLMGTDDSTQLHSVIRQLRQLADDAGQQNVINFDCQMRIGLILEHLLRDTESAYKHYRNLETHPLLNGNDIESDHRKVDLCCHIAQLARLPEIHQYDEAERYARLVMAYPYLGMEDREMYQRFYTSYDQAGAILLFLFRDDPQKLADIEIYPSHPLLYARRRELIERSLGVDQLTDDISHMVIEDDPVIIQALATDRKDDNNAPPTPIPVAEIGKDMTPMHQTAQPEQSNHRGLIICLGIVCISLMAALRKGYRMRPLSKGR